MPKYKRIILDHLIITAGAVLTVIGIALFAEPFQIAPGGVSGVANAHEMVGYGFKKTGLSYL